jgi:hypothetical protein
VIVRMRVDERSGKQRRLDSQRQRDGDYLPHGPPIVGDPRKGVNSGATEEWLNFSSEPTAPRPTIHGFSHHGAVSRSIALMEPTSR